MAEPCKCKEVECEECPEWIFTLADLIMCMMGLFVLLWVLKPEGKGAASGAPQAQAPGLMEVVAAIRDSFGYIPDANSNDPIDIFMIEQQRVRQLRPMNGQGNGGKTTAPDGAQGLDPEVTAIRTGPDVTLGTKVLFDPGQATLTAEARSVLDQIAAKIRGHKNVMLVKGHSSADDLKEGASEQQKMELSLARAQAARDYLISRGVEPDILRPLGCSTFEPVVQRVYTEQTRRQNRRVEIESSRTLVSELQDSAPSARPAELIEAVPTGKPRGGHGEASHH